MCSLRSLDCYRNVPLTFAMYISMFTKWNLPELFTGTLMNLGLSMIDYIIVIVGVLLMFSVSMIQRKGSVREMIDKKPVHSYL